MAKTLETVVLDGDRFLRIREQIQAGEDDSLKQALEHLRRQADDWLPQGPWSVMDKSKPSPSGDLHDYTSQAPYWWPSPSADGSPYVRRDGERNPEVLDFPDRVNVEKVFRSSVALGLAWFYTGGEAYGARAADVIRTWFLAPERRMNPNLNHAQLIPFANTGRHIGIIDFAQAYTTVLDVVVLLESGSGSGGPAPGWTVADGEAFRAWNREFLTWLTQSDFGRAERAEKNNHGVFASMLIAAIALFLGDEQAARHEVLKVQRGIDEAVEPDGAMPHELGRTRSWHYTTFTLTALTRLAMMAPRVGVDLWNYEGPRGQGILRAVEFVLPAATGAEGWGFPELEMRRFAAADVVRAAADAGHEGAGRAVDGGEVELPEGDLWPLRPAPEQLRPVGAKG
ncbi:hypothetical protein ESCO_001408 [Escovopsis weberi]|uniref:Alginate lyase domain-containing protein n=1 Tax=Escovopsis weberi TaxID=150374 RepID=A0A0M8N1F1_ESCWE|nr:hypothetical protein ESCO_001408 [Escovopsis weberi]